MHCVLNDPVAFIPSLSKLYRILKLNRRLIDSLESSTTLAWSKLIFPSEWSLLLSLLFDLSLNLFVESLNFYCAFRWRVKLTVNITELPVNIFYIQLSFSLKNSTIEFLKYDMTWANSYYLCFLKDFWKRAIWNTC